jgi:glycosyltransferase involved in cell wall biosynthesis
MRGGFTICNLKGNWDMGIYGHNHLNILGTRGVPAAHGGFETFAERLALYLVGQGVSVTVYCQSDGPADRTGREDVWNGIHRVHFGTRRSGAMGTMEFDLACVRHVLKRPGADLVLGYNTAIFNVLQRLKRRQVFVNMDGIEWKRGKWSMPAKIWLFCNEIIAANLATRPIADHPEIGRHVARRALRKPIVIPYGADFVGDADEAPVRELGVRPDNYFISVARIEPENSILAIIDAFQGADTGMDLVVVGNLDPDNAYHRKVRKAGGSRVLFPGAIYHDQTLKALRFHARAYLHGHQVGGTNPALVEALGAGNAVIAHDNRFNRWTAGEGQRFFATIEACSSHMRRLARDDLALHAARIAARERHEEDFQWHDVLARYQALLLGQKPALQIAAE